MLAETKLDVTRRFSLNEVYNLTLSKKIKVSKMASAHYKLSIEFL